MKSKSAQTKIRWGEMKRKKNKTNLKTTQDCGQKTQQQAYITTNFIKVRYSEKATKN